MPSILRDGQDVLGVDYIDYYTGVLPQFMPIKTNVLPSLPVALAGGPPVQAWVDFGRWVAECPDDRATSYVWRDTPVFMCPVCCNKAVDGQWHTVEFPDKDTLYEVEKEIAARMINGVVENWWCFDPRKETLEQFLNELKR